MGVSERKVRVIKHFTLDKMCKLMASSCKAHACPCPPAMSCPFDCDGKICMNINPDDWHEVLTGERMIEGTRKTTTVSPEEIQDAISAKEAQVAADTQSQRGEILEKAMRILKKQRFSALVQPSDNFETIARLWTGILGKTVSSREVILCMTCLSLARMMSNKADETNYTDAAALVALAHDLLEHEKA